MNDRSTLFIYLILSIHPSILSLLSLFWKIKRGLRDHLAVCVSVCLFISSLTPKDGIIEPEETAVTLPYKHIYIYIYIWHWHDAWKPERCSQRSAAETSIYRQRLGNNVFQHLGCPRYITSSRTAEKTSPLIVPLLLADFPCVSVYVSPYRY
jgi:hypothetical protein